MILLGILLTATLTLVLGFIMGFLFGRSRIDPKDPLEGGVCECGHNRSAHLNGRGYCHVIPYPSKPDFICACHMYIKKPRTIEEILKEGTLL